MIKRKLVAAGLLSAVMAPGFALAMDETPLPITGNLTFTSDYVFRGISQTNEKFAVQGGFDYAHEETGLYAGTWASNVNAGTGSVELDVYGGWKKSFGEFGLDLGYIHYEYENNSSLNTDEVYVGGSWKWFTAKYYYTISDQSFGFQNADGTQYYTVGASYELPMGLTIFGSYGVTKLEGDTMGSNNNYYNYDDWKVGVGYKYRGLDLAVAYTDTTWDNGNAEPQNIASDRVFASVTKTF
jgi:uncharacterized protein (TIGR02001 family)